MERHESAGYWGGALVVGLLLVAGLLVVSGIGGATHGTDTLVVDDDGSQCPGAQNETIQGAINHANASDRIVVCAGTYNESVVVNESVVLTTNQSAVLDGQGTNATGITIEASDVMVSNLTVRDYTTTGILGAPGSTLSNVTIRNNTVEGVGDSGGSGIHVGSGTNLHSNWVIASNTISNTDGNGLRLSQVSDIEVSNSSISQNIDGVVVDDTSHTNLTNNTLQNDDAVILNSDNITVENNDVAGDSQGIRLSLTNNSDLTNNQISGGAGNGISMEMASIGNNITSNTISAGTNGIILEGSATSDQRPQFNRIRNNSVTSSLVGINITNSNNNTFDENNISGNSQFGFYIQSGDDNLILENIVLSNDVADFRSESNAINNSVTNLTLQDTVISFNSRDVQISDVESPPPDPSGNVSVDVFVNATNTSSNSWLDINVSYNESELGFVNESTLSLWKHNASTGWTDTQGGLDETANVVSANITSFSTLAPLGTADVPGTAVSQCRNITDPGRYSLVDNITDSSASTCIRINASDVTFDGLGFVVDGDDAADTVGIQSTHTTAVENVTVRNVTVTDWAWGIEYIRTSGGLVANATVERNSADGINVYISSDNVTVRDSTVNHNGEEGIRVAGPDGLVADNMLDANDAGISIGFEVRATGNDLSNHTVGIRLTGPDNVVDNNTLDTASGSLGGGGIDADGTADRNVIQDNTVFGYDNGIRLHWVDNNSVRRNTLADSGSNGVFLENADDNILVANNVTENGNHGIFLNGGENNSLIENNASNNSQDGIRLSVVSIEGGTISSNNTTVRDNVANDNGLYGIYLTSGSHNTIANNTANDNVDSGFGIGIVATPDSIDNRFVDNVADGNSEHGFEFDASAVGVTLIENTATSNAADGFNVNASSDVAVLNNTARSNFGSGLNVGNLTAPRIEDNEFSENRESGLIVNDTSGAVIARNAIRSNAHGIHGAGIGNDTLVHNNTIESNVEPTTGVDLNVGGNVSNLTITENDVWDNNGDSIVVTIGSGDTLTGLVIFDNDIRGGDVGINLYADNTDAKLSNVTVSSNSIESAGGQSIHVDPEGVDAVLDSIVIEDNTINNSQGEGIEFELDSDLMDTIRDVQVRDNSITNIDDLGIHISADQTDQRVEGLEIVDNVVTDTSSEALELRLDAAGLTAPDLLIHGNTLARNGGESIEIDTQDTSGQVNVTLSQNVISDIDGPGIQFEDTGQNITMVVVENQVTNTSSGIQIEPGVAVVGTFDITNNNFVDNRNYGLENENETADTWVDARNNYWGAANGPGTNVDETDVTGSIADPVLTSTLANGAGDNVSAMATPDNDTSNVRFADWLDAPFDTAPPSGNGGGGGGGGATGGGGGGAGAPPPEPAPGQANMVITQATASPNPAEPGQDATITVTVENQGNYYGTLEVTLYVNGQDTGQSVRIGLPAESSETWTVTRSFPSPGEYALRANNETFGPLVVEAPGTQTMTGTPDGTDMPDGTATPTTETGQPGFGIAVAVLALLAATLLATRRQ